MRTDKLTSKEYRKWVEKIQMEGKELTAWEEDFVESMRQRIDEGWNLSDRQAEILEGIYSERTPN